MKTKILPIFTACILFSCSLLASPIKVACVGNSVTYGYGIENREQNAYPAQLQLLLGNQYDVRNFGKSGATLLQKGHRPYIRQEEYKEAIAFAPDQVVIHLGLNDTDPRNWPYYQDDFKADYYRLIDDFRKANPKVEIWICRLSPITSSHVRFKSGTRDWYRQIQQQIEEIASAAHTGLIDLQSVLYNRPDLLPDALHPTVEGAAMLAKEIAGNITGNFGGLQLPAAYSDNMVIQRDTPIRINGRADRGEEIVVSVKGVRKKTTAGPNGHWQITFPPFKPENDATLTISSPKKKLQYKHIAFGDVWLCSGQSNMAFTIAQSAERNEVIEQVSKPHNIRIYNMQPIAQTDNIEWDSLTLQAVNALRYYLPTTWQTANSENIRSFSAVGYWFGKTISDSIPVTIGLINNAVGGSPAESWIDRQTLEFDPQLVYILDNWLQNDMIYNWVRGRAAKNCTKRSHSLQRHPYEPAYLFESGMAPLTALPIKGIVWYQGESNEHNADLYQKIFPTAIDSWRKAWNDEKLPVYFVQLSSISRPSWPHFRNTQRLLAETIDRVAMAVSSDRGDSLDVHPRMKKDIGFRLALQALKMSYGKSGLTSTGPECNKVEFKKNRVILYFDNCRQLCTSDNKPARTFEVAGSNGIFHPATVKIEQNRIILHCPNADLPTAVRYGWQPFTRANLVNEASLPCSTFEITPEKI